MKELLVTFHNSKIFILYIIYNISMFLNTIATESFNMSFVLGKTCEGLVFL